MATAPKALDWSRIPTFLAVAETGSLSAAARQLGMSQPTLGRQIKAMEDELGVTLFTRQARGLVLTETGAELLAPAQAMQLEANRMALAAAGHEDEASGTVRITAGQVVAHQILPPIIAQIREAEPQIQIELSPSDATENLLFREADIALRMFRPEQLDVIARHVGDVALGAFCSQNYAQRHGLPTSIDELFERTVIGYDRDDRVIRGFRNIGYSVERTDFAIRCDDQVVNWQLVCAGCGIGFAPIITGETQNALVRVLPGAPMAVLPMWLTTHEAMRRTPRIRKVWDLLLAALSDVLAQPNPGASDRRMGDIAGNVTADGKPATAADFAPHTGKTRSR